MPLIGLVFVKSDTAFYIAVVLVVMGAAISLVPKFLEMNPIGVPIFRHTIGGLAAVISANLILR